ncbi:MAG: 16S rRNA (adenine(1518)-N(6)/adenine(1519)-N(6))-dimethyltransferase RsmA [Fretibacterium sp.]|nr:16S rRNA (adenine(1518)-N(6)/adenine(1519)-N(6))-dimethyltransferase RsmA [Fretibacterium sp.]
MEEIRALHRFGQHFLVDRNVLAEIIERSAVGQEDVVLEIGPGQGVLTRALLKREISCLHTVELDDRMKPGLETLAAQDSRLRLHWGDALRLDYPADLSPFPNKVVANIPYNITTPLIWKLLLFARLGLTYHLYMVQKEAADRLSAPADTRERYPLGVTLGVMGAVTRIRKVPASCFRPAPRVESALVEIVIQRHHDLTCDPLWSELLHRAFAHRRKTLLNNMKGFHGLEDWAGFLAETGVNPRARAEDLEGDVWLELYSSLRKRIGL